MAAGAVGRRSDRGRWPALAKPCAVRVLPADHAPQLQRKV
jgi:hypothetical protein